jgi:regulation of enolase protein 1 (concanavalin A-like superfamily)
MPPESSSFAQLNLPPTFALPSCLEYFTLTAQPNTNLWRKPPARDTSTAPIIYTTLRHPFVLAEVTVSADWEMEWDQGGLVIFAGAPPGRQLNASQGRRSSRNPTGAPELPPAKWVKAGLEFSAGTVNASSVCATADGADWSLSPLPTIGFNGSASALRIKLERIGHALWVWYQIPGLSPFNESPDGIGGSWKKLREVTWFFWGVEDKCVSVGVYASRPANFTSSITFESRPSGGGDGITGNGLVVEFEDLEIF